MADDDPQPVDMVDAPDVQCNEEDATVKCNDKEESAPHPPSFLNGELGTKTITLLAGPADDVKTYVVHQSLLCYHSPYYAAALNGSFKEANNDTMRIEDTEIDVVDIFANWLYTQSLPSETQLEEFYAPRSIRICASDPPTYNWDKLFLDLYIFADRYNVPRLRERVMDCFYSIYMASEERSAPYYETVINAFNSLPYTSPLCRLFVCVFVRNWDVDFDLNDVLPRDELPRDFLTGVTIEMGEFRKAMRVTGKEPDRQERCSYHEHATEEEKQACRELWRVKDAAEKGSRKYRAREEAAIAEEKEKQQDPEAAGA